MDIDIEKLAKAAASGFDLSNFKGDVVGVKIVENEFGIIEEGGIGVQKNYYGVQEEDTSIGDAPKKEEPQQEVEGEMRIGTIDEHKLAFRDAMLQVQETPYSQLPLEGMIKNVYDWYAVMRLGKDIGLFTDAYAGLTALMETNKRFREIPKDYRNFSAYTKYISKDFNYPNWQCTEKEQSYFRKFLSIANLTYSLYKANCKKQNIEPYK